MTTIIIYILSLILRATIQESVIYTPGSLSRTRWQNKAKPIDTSKDITDFASGNATRVTYNDHDINSLCYPINPIGTGPTIINYNIDSFYTPQLTMEVWIYPTKNGGINSNQYILGSENGEYERGIIMIGNDGIVLGTGDESGWTADKASYPQINKWTHIVGVWDDITGIAVIYVNGGTLKDGVGSDTIETFYASQSSQNPKNTNAVLNFGGSFTGCFGRIQITDKAVTAEEVVISYDATFGAFFGVGGVSGRRGGGGLGGGGVVISGPNQTPSPVGCEKEGCAQMFCCAAAVYSRSAKNQCPERDTMFKCEKMGKMNSCQWMSCVEQGECMFTYTGPRKQATNEMKLCKTYMSVSECESHNGCVWNPIYGNKFLNDMDAVFVVNNGSEYRNIKIYGLALFIFIGVMSLVYYYFCKCNASKVLLEENNMQVLDTYGSV